MKLRSLAPILAIALASAVGHAQQAVVAPAAPAPAPRHDHIGVYLDFDAQQFDQIGIYANPSNTPTGPHGNTDRPWLYGPEYGVYMDITHLPGLGALHTGPFVFGLDARGDTLRGQDFGGYIRQDGIFSLRLAMKSPVKKLHMVTPYIQAGFGIGHTKIPQRTYYNNNFIYQATVGIDRKFRNNIDWRVVEASASFLGSYQAGFANSGSTYPPGTICGVNAVTGAPLYCTSNASSQNSNYQITLGTGLIFRLH